MADTASSSFDISKVPRRIINLPTTFTIVAGPTKLQDGELLSGSGCFYNDGDLEKWMEDSEIPPIPEALRKKLQNEAEGICSRILDEIHHIEKKSLMERGTRASMWKLDQARRKFLPDGCIDSWRPRYRDTLCLSYPWRPTEQTSPASKLTGIKGMPRLNEDRPHQKLDPRVGHVEYRDYRDATVSEDGKIHFNEKEFRSWLPTTVQPVIVRTPLTIKFGTEVGSLTECSFDSAGIKNHLRTNGLPMKVVEEVLKELTTCSAAITKEVQSGQNTLGTGTEDEVKLLTTAAEKGRRWFDNKWTDYDGSRRPLRVDVLSSGYDSKGRTLPNRECTRYMVQINPEDDWLSIETGKGTCKIDRTTFACTQGYQNSDAGRGDCSDCGSEGPGEARLLPVLDTGVQLGQAECFGGSTRGTVLSVLGTIAAGAATGCAISYAGRAMGWLGKD